MDPVLILSLFLQNLTLFSNLLASQVDYAEPNEFRFDGEDLYEELDIIRDHLDVDLDSEDEDQARSR